MPNKRIPDSELIGKRFGMLVTLAEGPLIPVRGKSAARGWLCLCDCGITKNIIIHDLRSGKRKSCGCLKHKSRKGQAPTRISHGACRGYKVTPEYGTWAQMKERCLDPASKSYHHYGGRGITVCERWLEFENFLADMGEKPTPRHSLDRYPNNDGPYSPENCRWATQAEQQRNKRTNRFLTLNNETLCIRDWALRLDISDALISSRLARGFSDEAALLAPKIKSGRPKNAIWRTDPKLRKH